MGEKLNYDIAISFAGQDIDIALCIYLALKLYTPQTKQYYYPLRQKDMVGRKLLDRLTNIFFNESRQVILIVSKNYVNKENIPVQTEIKAFMKRFHKQKKPFLIPIIVDNTELKEVHEDLEGLTYTKWNHNPKELVEFIDKKPNEIGTSSQGTENRASREIKIVSDSAVISTGDNLTVHM